MVGFFVARAGIEPANDVILLVGAILCIRLAHPQ